MSTHDRHWTGEEIVRWVDERRAPADVPAGHLDACDACRARLAEVEALKQSRNGDDRFAMQRKLMPYDHLLPKTLRGRNERLGEPIAGRGAPGEMRAG